MGRGRHRNSARFILSGLILFTFAATGAAALGQVPETLPSSPAEVEEDAFPPRGLDTIELGTVTVASDAHQVPDKDEGDAPTADANLGSPPTEGSAPAPSDPESGELIEALEGPVNEGFEALEAQEAPDPCRSDPTAELPADELPKDELPRDPQLEAARRQIFACKNDPNPATVDQTMKGIRRVWDGLVGVSPQVSVAGGVGADLSPPCACARAPTVASSKEAVVFIPGRAPLDSAPSDGPPTPEKPVDEPRLAAAASQAYRPVPILFSLGLATLALSAAVAIAPKGRNLLRRLVGVPFAAFFTRIAGEDLLRHARRSALFGFVVANPGQRLAQAKKALSLANGSLRHHLKMLQGAGLVRVDRSCGAALLFAKGSPRPTQPYLPRQPRKILQLLQSLPGLSQKEVGARLGLSKRAVSRHASFLEASRLVRRVRDGRYLRLYAAAANVSLTTGGPAARVF